MYIYINTHTHIYIYTHMYTYTHIHVVYRQYVVCRREAAAQDLKGEDACGEDAGAVVVGVTARERGCENHKILPAGKSLGVLAAASVVSRLLRISVCRITAHISVSHPHCAYQCVTSLRISVCARACACVNKYICEYIYICVYVYEFRYVFVHMYVLIYRYI